MFILSAVALLESLQATSDSSRSEFLIRTIEHQNSSVDYVDYAPFNFMKMLYCEFYFIYGNHQTTNYTHMYNTH